MGDRPGSCYRALYPESLSPIERGLSPLGWGGGYFSHMGLYQVSFDFGEICYLKRGR